MSPKLPVMRWGRVDKLIFAAVVLFGLANLVLNFFALS